MIKDCENVWSSNTDIWSLLVAIPHLLHVLLLQPLHHEGLVHSPHVPDLLLAGHGQLLCQPHGLLCHEQEVMSCTNTHSIFLPVPGSVHTSNLYSAAELTQYLVTSASQEIEAEDFPNIQIGEDQALSGLTPPQWR